MKADEMIELCKQHTMFSWSAQANVAPLAVERGEGIYFWDVSGKRYIDFNCQLMCTNLGHSHPKLVRAIQAQAEKLFYVWPGAGRRPMGSEGFETSRPLVLGHHLDQGPV